MYTDKALIDKILAGNLGVYKQMVQRHERLVNHMISRIINDEEDIKDVSQEVFIKVYQNLGKFNYQSKLSTWIAKIAYGISINYAKKRGNKSSMHFELIEDDLVDYATPEHILNSKNEAEFIQYHIKKLPSNYRTVLTLYHLNEFSYQEIEDITGMPEGTVKNYLFRARRMLKERLQHFYKN